MNRFGIGQPVRRVEDLRFTTGRGHIADAHNQDLQREADARCASIMRPRSLGGKSDSATGVHVGVDMKPTPQPAHHTAN